jgi:hypothetical protein
MTKRKQLLVATRRCSSFRSSTSLDFISRTHRVGAFIALAYLIASGLVGDPTAPVIGIAGATNMNS